MGHIVTVMVDGCKVCESEVDLARPGWDREIATALQEGKVCVAEAILAAEDLELAGKVPPEWESRGREKRSVLTAVGEVTVKRRVFKSPEGERRKPLDERLGLVKYQRVARSVEQMGAYFATLEPYRAAEFLGYFVGQRVSRTRIGRMCWKMGAEWLALDEAERQAIFGRGEAPEPGAVRAKTLYVETDGVWIALQHEERRKAEVRVGVLYSGKEPYAHGRNQLVDIVTLTKLVPDSQVWQELILRLADRTYDLSQTEWVIVGGDGGAWVRYSADRIELPTCFQLDRFHLMREARRALPGRCNDLMALTHKATQEGLEAVRTELLALVAAQPEGKPRQKLQKFYDYLDHNADGVLDYRIQLGLNLAQYPSLGAIEGNVDKLVAQRMKGRGMSWREAGAAAMLALCEHRKELAALALPTPPPTPRSARPDGRKKHQREETWLQASVPAVHSCAENHPWARRLKRESSGQARIAC